MFVCLQLFSTGTKGALTLKSVGNCVPPGLHFVMSAYCPRHVQDVLFRNVTDKRRSDTLVTFYQTFTGYCRHDRLSSTVIDRSTSPTRGVRRNAGRASDEALGRGLSLKQGKKQHIFVRAARIAQLIQRLATDWTVRGSNPGEELFLTHSDRL